jgi:hypothetical protein
VEYPWHPLFGQELIVRSELTRTGETVLGCCEGIKLFAEMLRAKLERSARAEVGDE